MVAKDLVCKENDDTHKKHLNSSCGVMGVKLRNAMLHEFSNFTRLAYLAFLVMGFNQQISQVSAPSLTFMIKVRRMLKLRPFELRLQSGTTRWCTKKDQNFKGFTSSVFMAQ